MSKLSPTQQFLASTFKMTYWGDELSIYFDAIGIERDDFLKDILHVDLSTKQGMMEEELYASLSDEQQAYLLAIYSQVFPDDFKRKIGYIAEDLTEQ
jgi:hypothetical protein